MTGQANYVALKANHTTSRHNNNKISVQKSHTVSPTNPLYIILITKTAVNRQVNNDNTL